MQYIEQITLLSVCVGGTPFDAEARGRRRKVLVLFHKFNNRFFKSLASKVVNVCLHIVKFFIIQLCYNVFKRMVYFVCPGKLWYRPSCGHSCLALTISLSRFSFLVNITLLLSAVLVSAFLLFSYAEPLFNTALLTCWLSFCRSFTAIYVT